LLKAYACFTVSVNGHEYAMITEGHQVMARSKRRARYCMPRQLALHAKRAKSLNGLKWLVSLFLY
jgi:hypothetical protein